MSINLQPLADVNCWLSWRDRSHLTPFAYGRLVDNWCWPVVITAICLWTVAIVRQYTMSVCQSVRLYICHKSGLHIKRCKLLYKYTGASLFDRLLLSNIHRTLHISGLFLTTLGFYIVTILDDMLLNLLGMQVWVYSCTVFLYMPTVTSTRKLFIFLCLTHRGRKLSEREEPIIKF
jgi:hypothetical protein